MPQVVPATVAIPTRAGGSGRGSCQNADVQIRKLESTTAFIAVDLDGADTSVGQVRLAPKVLQDGAKLLARSWTYAFASFEMEISGASAGINAGGDTGPDALAAFVPEFES